MSLKTVIARKYTETTHLGSMVFDYVPVMVDESFKAKPGAVVSLKKGDEFSVGGDVIRKTSKVIAIAWLKKKVEKNELSMTPEEFYGVMVELKLNMTQVAEILGVAKGTISRMASGDLKVSKSQAGMLMVLLAQELSHEGSAKAFLSGKLGIIVSTPVQFEAESDYRQLA